MAWLIVTFDFKPSGLKKEPKGVERNVYEREASQDSLFAPSLFGPSSEKKTMLIWFQDTG